ncbi:glyoxylase-like metal-dependent hydrolase (beta-lactamase superfamily II) [Scopulibacillus daqui]|uniref:Glyoxylase-like metal-dependent hydrolase (Beta-lactamase superfamily II) n=1 Tax=Scopulibacillus daqui TaxID=1469162 RepID=A0ABS2Q403_9BACL|nr:hypothetical protein [Scopulibacillus daqui]MBM7646931.1 glyoxylase-like metal-dependent hydrolase (beta-lactamase superfamily II) [Scopulibacillus daqui]
MFTGDTAGVRYEWLKDDGIDFFLPTTSPNHFDPEAMIQSIDRIREYGLDRLYFGRFNMTENVEEAFQQVSKWIPVFVKEGEKALSSGKSVDGLVKSLHDRVSKHLKSFHIPENHKVFKVLDLDLQVSAMGIIDYLQKQNNLLKS